MKTFLAVICLAIIVAVFVFCIVYAIRCFLRYRNLQTQYEKLQDGLLNPLLSQGDLKQICDEGIVHTIHECTRTLEQKGFDADIHRERWETFLRFGLGTDFKITNRAIGHSEFQHQLCIFWEHVYEKIERPSQMSKCFFFRHYRDTVNDDLRYLWKHSSAETQDKFRGKLNTDITGEV